MDEQSVRPGPRQRRREQIHRRALVVQTRLTAESVRTMSEASHYQRVAMLSLALLIAGRLLDLAVPMIDSGIFLAKIQHCKSRKIAGSQ